MITFTIVTIICYFIFMYKITQELKKGNIKKEYTFFWYAFLIFIILVLVFLNVPSPMLSYLSNMFNDIFLLFLVLTIVINIMLFKLFMINLENAKLQNKVIELTQKIALKEKDGGHYE